MRGTRLDVEIARRGLAASRERAHALILAGRVQVPGVQSVKPGTAVTEDAVIHVQGDDGWVSRGALKLIGALDLMGIACEGKIAADIGSSTGGFTEVLLSRGARVVYAFDSGRGQLHERLRQDPRVISRERTNARYLSENDFGEPPELVVMDVSFISVLKVLPALIPLSAERADFLVLVKPQFEAGRSEVGRGGIVKDPDVHRAVLEKVNVGALQLNLRLRGSCVSSILGADGNREFFIHWTRATDVPSRSVDFNALTRVSSSH